jgi:hypothetical protein
MAYSARALSICLALGAGPLAAQDSAIEPSFAIWDVKLGLPVTQIPDTAAAIIACGTFGGPASTELASFADWAQCPPEPTGLHEVQFSYDDEKDYIARAMEMQLRALAGGTSVYAHPVVLSVLVDDKGLAQGIRVITDDRASDHDRRVAMALSRNLKDRFGEWGLTCTDIPMRDGEMKVGNDFTHERCVGENPDIKGQKLLIEASYLRKKGQEAISQDTQAVNKGYYESRTWMELVNDPYPLSEVP